MQEYIEVLKSVKLFEAIGDADLISMLSCLGAKIVYKKKDEYILTEGSKPEHIGIVLEGSLKIIKDDIDGERIIVDALIKGNFFAEALCCAGILESPVSVVSCTYSTVMLLEFNKILHSCPNSCSFHAKLIENMLYILAQKNLLMQTRLDITGKKTLRKKILCFFDSFVKEQNQSYITIPYDREELADFLCVDRSALSHELSRMKKDGIIDYHKNNFKLL